MDAKHETEHSAKAEKFVKGHGFGFYALLVVHALQMLLPELTKVIGAITGAH